jgi:translation elongation factor EF-Ts
VLCNAALERCNGNMELAANRLLESGARFTII